MPRPGPRRAFRRVFHTNDDGRSTLKKSVAVPLLDAVRVSSVDPAGPEVDVLTSPGVVWDHDRAIP